MVMLKPLWVTAALLQAACRTQAAAVFAHFMVQNTQHFNVTDWTYQMNVAAGVHIEAFALNIANGWEYNDQAIAYAFQAADAMADTFKLFFSFDYPGGSSPWDASNVTRYIQTYASHPSYFYYKGKPFVSTFEGPNNAEDWVGIKAATNCFFMPDWSSDGAGPALARANGVADGLFSWAAWPWGPQNMTTYVDASYIQDLQAAGNKPYMMPVSPWFYTNMPGFDKNWLWNGGDLWYERWKQVWYLQPEFVEIISWNDFGESHYIGPLDDSQYEAFGRGNTTYNYALDMPHDGWRQHLPWVIDIYKTGTASFDQESVVTWLRPTLNNACNDGGTTGNTASQLEIEFPPAELMPNRVYITALLGSPASANVLKGGYSFLIEDWDYTPDGGVGLYHTSIEISEATTVNQPWAIEIFRGTTTIIDFQVQHETLTECTDNIMNWNAWVSDTWAPVGPTYHPPRKLADMNCTSGRGAGNFDDLCQFTCQYGYCPIGACVCTNMGKLKDTPEPKNIDGYPANGDANYAGLCSFACNYGHCPPAACSLTKQPDYIPTVSPFTPNACTSGSGSGALAGLCSYACNFGFCPIHHCTCDTQGALNPPPAQTYPKGQSLVGDDSDLCNFACTRGYCPPGTCAYESASTWDFPDGSCTTAQQKVIEAEITYAVAMAQAARDGLTTVGNYYERFFDESSRSGYNFDSGIRDTYGRMVQMLSGTSTVYEIKYTCVDDKVKCQDLGWYAYMSDDLQRMNFCPRFFDLPKVNGVAKAKGTLDRLNDDCPSNMDIQKAQWTRAAFMIHEVAHTEYAMMGRGKAHDYAYGFSKNVELPQGTFDRSCVPYAKHGSPLCPGEDGKEGVCPETMTVWNADTYSFVAAGIYFQGKCGNQQLPDPPPPANPPAKRTIGDEVKVAVGEKRKDHEPNPRGIGIRDSITGNGLTRRNEDYAAEVEQWDRRANGSRISLLEDRQSRACQIDYDYLPIDGQDGSETTVNIRGLVSFGDSFAAGMGTGTTTSDKCRVGSNNYGKLLRAWLGGDDVPFDSRVCSGDTTDGLNQKIDAWSDTSTPNVGTLTIGGNDLGFSDLVYYCVITPNTYYLGSTNRRYCTDAETKARNHMADTSTSGLPYLLKEAYKRIIQKSGQPDFHLFVTGYPEFFNEETSDCEKSSFHYWWGAYNPPSDWPLSRIVYLTASLRTELDDLVRALNDVIINAVAQANAELGGSQIHYVDVTAFFDNQHWCEDGVHEPDSNAPGTWFFLSGWKDLPATTAGTTTPDYYGTAGVDTIDTSWVESSEIQSLIAQGSVPMPDAGSCQANLGLNPDPYDVAMCYAAINISQEPDGPEAERLAAANAAIKAGNVTSQDIAGYLPTRQIKTFHPRTPGMMGFRDAIIEVMNTVGNLN